MHIDPDYSAAYVDPEDRRGLEGHGLTFTIGRGNEVVRRGDRGLPPSRRRASASTTITSDFAGFWRWLASDSQLRWLGPEKGVIHLALAAIVNAVWDLYAKAERKPVWKLLADMTPRQIVSCIDFRYITDALTPDEAIEMLERHARTKARARGGAAARRLSRLHDVGRLDGLLRRRASGACAARRSPTAGRTSR